MKKAELKEGVLNGVVYVGKYNTGEIEAYKVEEESKLTIGNHEYTPLYSYLDARRKEFPAVRMYKNKKIKSIALEKPEEIETKYGIYLAEKVIFYEDGNVKRIFPLDGKISGYWSEDDEYELAKEYSFKLLCGEFKTKVISLYFYESGNIKSITLWPKEIIKINLNNRIFSIRTGISFYESGNVSSCEPVIPIKIHTSIGIIEAFDKNALGICADINSLEFYENGDVKALITSTNVIEVYKNSNLVNIHSPKEERIYSGSDEMELVTVKVQFNKNNIIIDNNFIYDINEYKFNIKRYGENKLTLSGDLLK